MFCAIVTAIERCKTEGVVDVFQVVKALRVQKPGAVLTMVSFLPTKNVLASVSTLNILKKLTLSFNQSIMLLCFSLTTDSVSSVV